MESVTSEATIEGLGAVIVELRFLNPRATRCAVEAMRRAGLRVVIDEGGRYRVVGV